MYYSSHLFVGATVGLMTNHPVKAVIAGLASHIILDLIPHHDHEGVKTCIFDVIGGTVLFSLWYFFYQPGINILAGAIAGVLPDIEIVLYYFKLMQKKYFPSHNGWTPHAKSGYPKGVFIQLITIGLAIWFIS